MTTTQIPVLVGFQKSLESMNIFTKKGYSMQRKSDGLFAYFIYLMGIYTIIKFFQNLSLQNTGMQYASLTLELLAYLFVEMFFLHAYLNGNLFWGFLRTGLYMFVLNMIINGMFGKPIKPIVQNASRVAKESVAGAQKASNEVSKKVDPTVLPGGPEAIDADVEKPIGEENRNNKPKST